MQFIQSRFAKSKQTVGWWAMSWNRPQSINPVIYVTSRRVNLELLPFRGRNKEKWETHLWLQPRGPSDYQRRIDSDQAAGQKESPRSLTPQPRSPEGVWSAPCFFQFCVQYGKLLDCVVRGWPEHLARDRGTWGRVKGSQGCFLSLLSEEFTLAGPGRSGHLGPRPAPNTLLSLFHPSPGQTVNKLSGGSLARFPFGYQISRIWSSLLLAMICAENARVTWFLSPSDDSHWTSSPRAVLPGFSTSALLPTSCRLSYFSFLS